MKSLSTAPGIAAIHALWTLQGLGLLDADTHRAALLSPDAVLRRNAVRALPLDKQGAALIFQSGVINDPDLTTRLAALVALAQLPTSQPIKNAVRSLGNKGQNRDDEWLSAALAAAAKNHGVSSLAHSRFRPSDVNLIADAEWKPRTYQGQGAVHTRPASQGIGGTPCLKIVSGKPSDTSWQTIVAVRPGTRYRLGAMVKTRGITGTGLGALLNVHELQDPRVATKALRKNSDWTEVHVDFDSLERTEISVNALFGGWGQSTGTAWWDKLQLNELEPVAEDEDSGKLRAGDAELGKALFATHPVAACNRCHAVDGHGGVIGPALDTLATRKEPDYIRSALIEPNADIAEGYPLQVSPMPPMNLLLKPQEIEDIIAYLQTLK